MSQNPNIRVKFAKNRRLRQGDIIKDVDYIESADEVNGIIQIKKIRFPYVIVLTQDCDLTHDDEYRADRRRRSPIKADQDKIILSILVAPIYNMDHVLNGSHLSQVDNMKMQTFNVNSSKVKEVMLKNDLPRYHYLAFDARTGIPQSVIDFKHFFSVNVELLKSKKKKGDFVCSVSELYRERISQRFSEFLGRIGLPDN